MAMASTGLNDVKWGDSNYGTWVEGTATVETNGFLNYIFSSGSHISFIGDGATSTAAPLTSGLAALIKAMVPTVQNWQIRDIINATCDNIDAVNPSFVGLLGSGRINAYNALNLIAAAPSTPQNFSVSGSTGQHPTLTWSANTEADLDGYKIYVKYGSGSYSLLTSVDKNTTSFTDPGVTIGGGKFSTQVCYKITSFDIAANESDYAFPDCVNASSLSKEGDIGFTGQPIPKSFQLYPASPNPFNPSATIRFDLPEESKVKIEIFNSQGKLVRVLTEQIYQASSSKILFDGSNLSSGVYIYKITAVSQKSGKSFTDVKRMSLIK
jgi:Secretion system C-terminal sorting domain